MTAAVNLSIDSIDALYKTCLKKATQVLGVIQEPDIDVKLAQVAVEVDRCVCQAAGIDMPKPWAEMTDEDRTHVTAAVRSFHADTSCTPETLHEAWVKSATEDGWTTGDLDAEKKTHPLLMPYSKLPMLQVLRDTLFLSSVRLGGLVFSGQ
jgi:hypothetical protein